MSEEGVITEHKLAAELDPTLLSKSEKKTYGLGFFYNATNSKSEKELETNLLALLDLSEKTAYGLKVTQAPAELAEEETRTDFYSKSIQQEASSLLKIVKYLVVDGGFAKKKFVDGVCETGIHLVENDK